MTSSQLTDDDILPASALEKPSALAPRVVVYSSDEAVPSQRFVAYITVPTRAPKTGATSERRLGISFPAATYEAAQAAANAFWQAELNREREKQEAALVRGERLAAQREAKAPSSPVSRP